MKHLLLPKVWKRLVIVCLVLAIAVPFSFSHERSVSLMSELALSGEGLEPDREGGENSEEQLIEDLEIEEESLTASPIALHRLDRRLARPTDLQFSLPDFFRAITPPPNLA